MLSGKDGFFDKIRGRMAGSTAYITKPFKPEAFTMGGHFLSSLPMYAARDAHEVAVKAARVPLSA